MNLSNPLVSICCITYNHENFIRQALDGFLMQQTNFPIEIIIHDDASTDNTANIIREYQGKHPHLIKPILQTENQYSQGKKVSPITFKQAQGKYIALCEGDDYWTDPLKLQKQVDFLEANPDFAICFHKVKIWEEGQLKDNYITRVPSSVSTIVDLAKGNYIHTPSCLFRNNTEKILGANYLNCPLGDYYFHMMNAQYGKLFYIDEVMAVYRVHNNSIWSSKSQIYRIQKTSEAILCILQDLSDTSIEVRQELKSNFTKLAANICDIVNLQKKLSSHSQPLVSICIPTYNGENFITESISSALSQTYPNIEIILSDDNTSDRTVHIAQDLQKQSPFEFSIFKHRQYGLAQNWNFCISQAKGKYIKFLFQDDILQPNCIEEMVYLAEEDQEIGLVFSPRQVFVTAEQSHYAQLLVESIKDLHKSWSQLQPIQSGQKLLQDPHILDHPINKIGEPSIVLIKKEVFDKVGLFNPELCQIVDVEMWLRIMSHYKIGFVNQVLSGFRIHPEQQTQRNIRLKNAIDSDYKKFFSGIANDSRYPQLTRQNAACRYGVLTANYPELQQLRKEIATQLLNTSDDELPEIYAGLLGNTYKILLHSGIHNQNLTQEEEIFLKDITINISPGLQQPKAIQYLLAYMLYCQGDQLLPSFIADIPHWLLPDYLQFLFSSQSYFKQIGEADNYYQYLQKSIDYLHTSIFTNPDSELWHQVTNYFTRIANFIPACVTERNLKDIYVKRAEIIEYCLKLNGHKIDYDFSERPVNRKKIRLGILASNFTPGSETFAYLPIYEYLSRDFEVILYSLTATGHKLEKYCLLSANAFKLLPQELSAQVNRIRADDLDILFIATNVTLFTNQICLLAIHRLARIQLTSGGSVVTTGMRNMDYYISGTLTDPSPTAQDQYQEKLVKLEGTAHCFSYGTEEGKITIPVERQQLGIPENAVVFVSCANFFKIIPELMETWAKIITQVPNSVLVLFPFGPNWSNSYPKQEFINHLKSIFTKYGLATERLIVLDPQPVPDRQDMKEYYKIADIYLDSFPFAGTTSLIEPLQVNLPLIARQGNCFRSAMGAAMIQTLNIPGLVADSEEHYIELADALGNNSELRQQKRNQIEEKIQDNPSFLDSRSYSAKMGNLFQELFSNYLKANIEESLNLREINYIIFPDWTQPEEEVGFELQQLIQALATHPDNEKITLLVNTGTIATEDAEMFLSSVTMNLVMMEDLDISDSLNISLIPELANTQWQSLLSRIHSRIILNNEDATALKSAPISNVSSVQIDNIIPSSP